MRLTLQRIYYNILFIIFQNDKKLGVYYIVLFRLTSYLAREHGAIVVYM